MRYEKPELSVLSLAVSAVRTSGDSDTLGSNKGSTFPESGQSDNDTTQPSSSSSAAYQADE